MTCCSSYDIRRVRPIKLLDHPESAKRTRRGRFPTFHSESRIYSGNRCIDVVTERLCSCVKTSMEYDEIADLFDDLSSRHEHIAKLLEQAEADPVHGQSNEALATAERVHADACRRAAEAIRRRKQETPGGH